MTLSHRRPDPAKVFRRAALLLCGVALTWTCAAFGLLVSQGVFGGGCRYPHVKQAVNRVRAVETAIVQFQIDRGRCPRSPAELSDAGFVSEPDLVDPWHRSIVFTCAGDEARVASAGPDGRFGTADDVRNER
jgi:hypothetical protein